MPTPQQYILICRASEPVVWRFVADGTPEQVSLLYQIAYALRNGSLLPEKARQMLGEPLDSPPSPHAPLRANLAPQTTARERMRDEIAAWEEIERIISCMHEWEPRSDPPKDYRKCLYCGLEVKEEYFTRAWLDAQGRS